jgi:hypothetical protein
MRVIFFIGKKSNPFVGLHMLQQKAVSHSKTLEHTIVCCSFQAGDTAAHSAILLHTLQLNHPSPLFKCHPVSVHVSFWLTARLIFLSVKILQHSCLIMHLTGPQQFIFLQCKLSH